MDKTFWLKQTGEDPLFKNTEWEKPEQKAKAGKLLIIGGNKFGLAVVSSAYQAALQAGVGECRVVLPDVLKKNINLGPDCLFLPSNPSGGFSKEGIGELQAYSSWADSLLLIGESGRNSETAILHEQLVLTSDKLLVITRDALDLVRNSAAQWLKNPQLTIVATFAQLQKIFQVVHYPKMLLFRMQLLQLVDNLHKFTITYPVKIITLHQDQLIVASEGQVGTTPCLDNLIIWRGIVASYASVYWTWFPQKSFAALNASIAKLIRESGTKSF